MYQMYLHMTKKKICVFAGVQYGRRYISLSCLPHMHITVQLIKNFIGIFTSFWYMIPIRLVVTPFVDVPEKYIKKRHY